MPTTRRLTNEPGLDGIRGLAIVLVMMVHIGVRQGGFVGVDLFFVLSGFLITTLLLQERERSGRVSYRRFYLRRAFRLLPALGVAILLGYVARSVLPFRVEQAPYWAVSLAALLYVTNWVQLADRHAIRLLAHTWSLAVEEQFYLVWPASLLLALGRWRREVRTVLTIVGAVTAASLLSLVIGFRVSPDANLYVATTSRAGELLLGAALSVLWRHRRMPRALSAPLTGVAALAALGLVFDTASEGTTWLYQWGGLYVAAAVGVVLVATVIERPQAPLTRLLRTRPLRYTGRISYSMYLYNYPLTFILSKPVIGIPTAYCQVLMLAATWLLASVSFFVLERPIIAWGRRHEPRVPEPQEAERHAAVAAHAGEPGHTREPVHAGAVAQPERIAHPGEAAHAGGDAAGAPHPAPGRAGPVPEQRRPTPLRPVGLPAAGRNRPSRAPGPRRPAAPVRRPVERH